MENAIIFHMLSNLNSLILFDQLCARLKIQLQKRSGKDEDSMELFVCF